MHCEKTEEDTYSSDLGQSEFSIRISFEDFLYGLFSVQDHSYAELTALYSEHCSYTYGHIENSCLVKCIMLSIKSYYSGGRFKASLQHSFITFIGGSDSQRSKTVPLVITVSISGYKQERTKLLFSHACGCFCTDNFMKAQRRAFLTCCV